MASGSQKGWCAVNKTVVKAANKFEVMKAEKDGLDIWPDLLRYVSECTPVSEIPEDDLQRMKWFGVFHRIWDAILFLKKLLQKWVLKLKKFT